MGPLCEHVRWQNGPKLLLLVSARDADHTPQGRTCGAFSKSKKKSVAMIGVPMEIELICVDDGAREILGEIEKQHVRKQWTVPLNRSKKSRLRCLQIHHLDFRSSAAKTLIRLDHAVHILSTD